MKKILGLDLGTTSIGWAFVKEADNDGLSSIEKIGVRVNPLTTDEQTDFEKGKPVSINADRTLKRGARRNLDRYQLRRNNLIEVLKENQIISDKTILAETDKNTTHSTFHLRSKAATEKIEIEEFVRALLMINKKRGYKSSRKAKNEDDEGQIIDGMAIAKKLYEESLTPGQLSYQLLKDGKKYLPDFYRSDLQAEFDKVWKYQQQFYPEIFSDSLRKELDGKVQRATSAIFWTKYALNTSENKGTRDEKKLKAYEWRSKAMHTKLSKEEVACVITEINNNINSSSGYLGEISDRSKELYFNRETVGQYLYKQLKGNPHTRMKNQVFYRQDYFDEFETIWEKQTKYYDELTPELKAEIRDIIIFYQRKLKSQKGLISYCGFESKEKVVMVDGQKKIKNVGAKVIPKSSPLFQEFKIWQNLNNLQIQNKGTKEVLSLDQETKQLLFDQLNIRGNLSKNEVLKLITDKPNHWNLNFETVEGNRTNQTLYEGFVKILEYEGNDEIDKENITTEKLKDALITLFESLNINTSILEFNANLEGKEYEKQASFQLWHLLYSYEGDNSNSGNDHLHELMEKKFGFKKEHSKFLANLNFQQDYGSLSTKAIRKILPYLIAGHPFSKNDKENDIISATAMAGYNHSSSQTKEENEKRLLKDKMEILPKNSLRNPVVEKILNQMVNVVNSIIADPSLGKPDEIRIELARELKKNAKEREEMTASINRAKGDHDDIRKKIIEDFGIKNPSSVMSFIL